MTTIFTRLYASQDIAAGVRDRLYRAGFPRHMMRIVTCHANGEPHGLMSRIRKARVPAREASVYAARVAEGGALLIVTAGYKPLGAVRIGREALRGTGALPCNVEAEEFKVAKLPDHAPSVLKDHPRFLTAPPDPDHPGGPLSDQLGFSMVSSTRRMNSALKGGRLIFPFPALTRGRNARSAIKGGGHYSRVFWPMKLVTRKPRRRSVIPGGGHPFSHLLGWRTTS